MRVDYAAIKTADPGGTLESAYTTLSAETVSRSRGKYRITQAMIADELGMVLAKRFREGLEAAVTASVLPQWAFDLLDDPGLNINSNQVQTVLGQIVNAGALTQADVDAVIALGTETIAKWPRLKHGHIANSRESNFGKPD